ncbi:MAG: MBL fold metallo-hydrolase [Bacilli bacterium]|nr:MBL fold metallo-hydrolase [Bacilli bacterium]
MFFMKIERFNIGDDYVCNMYIVGEEGEPCIVVDPGADPNNFIEKYVRKHHNGEIAGFLLTHGHYDHIEGLRLCTMQAPVYVHLLEEEFLVEPAYNLSLDFLDHLYIRGLKTKLFIDKDVLNIGNYEIKVIHTPFHTRGSSCFYFEKERVLFSGDTLFHLSIGRTDLITGSNKTVESSLQKLVVLPPETKVYPGHGPATTIGDELRLNPYLTRLKK